MKLPKTALAALAVISALALTPAGAEEAAPSLSTFTAAAEGDAVRVKGTGAFAAPAFAVAQDAVGDAAAKQIGMDLTGASIAQLSSSVLRFQIDVADGIPVVGTIPQAVYYNWKLAVGNGTSTSNYNLQAIRADMYSVALNGTEPGDPVFRLQTCVLNEQTGGQSCTTAAQLAGEFGDGYVALDVPMAAISAKPGSKIMAGDQPINANFGAGAVWFNGDTAWGDAMTTSADYVVPLRTVTLGLAPAGTPAEAVELTTPAALSTAGRFDELLSGGAAGDVVAAKVCAGDVCSLQSTTVE